MALSRAQPSTLSKNKTNTAIVHQQKKKSTKREEGIEYDHNDADVTVDIDTDTVKRKPKKKKSLDASKAEAEALSDMESQFDQMMANASNDELVYLKEYRLQYRRLKKLIKLSYDMCASGKASVQQHYILNGYISQQREVINDLRSMTDASGQVTMLITEVLQPLANQMSQLVLNTYHAMLKLSEHTAKDDKAKFAQQEIQKYFSAIGQGIQQNLERAEAAIGSLLLSQHDAKPKGKGKKK